MPESAQKVPSRWKWLGVSPDRTRLQRVTSRDKTAQNLQGASDPPRRSGSNAPSRILRDFVPARGQGCGHDLCLWKTRRNSFGHCDTLAPSALFNIYEVWGPFVPTHVCMHAAHGWPAEMPGGQKTLGGALTGEMMVMELTCPMRYAHECRPSAAHRNILQNSTSAASSCEYKCTALGAGAYRGEGIRTNLSVALQTTTSCHIRLQTSPHIHKHAHVWLCAHLDSWLISCFLRASSPPPRREVKDGVGASSRDEGAAQSPRQDRRLGDIGGGVLLAAAAAYKNASSNPARGDMSRVPQILLAPPSPSPRPLSRTEAV